MNRAMTSSAIRLLRVAGVLEGISFLVLLGVAMPLKYFADTPLAVRVVGMAHGVLFLVYLGAAVQVFLVARWPASRLLSLVAAAVLPFGPFVIDRRLRLEQAVAEAADVATAAPPPGRIPG
jgi:integral membrane protein